MRRDAIMARNAYHADKDGWKKCLQAYDDKKSGVLDFAQKLGVRVIK